MRPLTLSYLRTLRMEWTHWLIAQSTSTCVNHPWKVWGFYWLYSSIWERYIIGNLFSTPEQIENTPTVVQIDYLFPLSRVMTSRNLMLNTHIVWEQSSMSIFELYDLCTDAVFLWNVTGHLGNEEWVTLLLQLSFLTMPKNAKGWEVASSRWC